MPSEIEVESRMSTVVKWGDIATLEYGKALRGYDPFTGAFRVFGTNGPIGWTDTYLSEGPGVIIGRKGAYRGVHYSSGPFHVIDTAFYLKPRAGVELDLKWAYYQLLTQDIDGLDSGSAIPSTSRDSFYGLSLRLVPIKEQLRVAAVLTSFDDKIDLNRRMNATLEAVARTNFKSWSEGLPLVTVYASDLIDAGVLEIGDGYRAKHDEFGPPGLPFVRAAELNNGFNTDGAELLNQSVLHRVGNKRSRPGDVAFTSKGTIGRFARVSRWTSEFVYSPQVCYWRSLDHSQIHPSILYCWMLGEGFMRQVEAVAGQTDMAPYVSLRDQRAMQVPDFRRSNQEIGDHLQRVLDQRAVNDAEIRLLASIRDALLPKLISGKMEVSNDETPAADGIN
jgi:type I restriction enzyme, S subunit